MPYRFEHHRTQFTMVSSFSRYINCRNSFKLSYYMTDGDYISRTLLSHSFLSSVECYSNAWTEVTQLRLRRMGACAVAYRHGILVAGGYGREDGETPVILDVVELIDLDTFRYVRCYCSGVNHVTDIVVNRVCRMTIF